MRARTTSQIDWSHARLTVVSLGGHASGFSSISQECFFLGCKIIEVYLSRLLFRFPGLSLVPYICIHICDGSFAEVIKKDGWAPESTSLEVYFLYVWEFLEKFSPGNSFEFFSYVFWFVSSCINGDVYMVLVESNLPQDPTILFTDFAEKLFTTSLNFRKVKDVVKIFGFEA